MQKTSLKKCFRSASNFIALISSRSFRQMLANFLRKVNSKVQEKLEERGSLSCAHPLKKT